MNISRLSIILFIIGVGMSILSGFLEKLDPNVTILVLVAAGIFVGLLNITEEQEIGFLIGAAAYILAVVGLTTLLRNLAMMRVPLMILNNLVVFIGAATVVVSLKILFEFSHKREEALAKEEAKKPVTFNRAWGFVVLVSVIAAIMLVLLTLFFDTTAYGDWISFLDWTITFIFVIDLVILYKAAEDFWDFLKHDWLDIIATVPFWFIFKATLGLAFRFAKVLRFVKILRVLSKSSKAAKALTVSRTLKLWSKRSHMTEHVKKKRRRRPIEHLHAKAVKEVKKKNP